MKWACFSEVVEYTSKGAEETKGHMVSYEL
jgi:hypothetical protein